MVEEELEPPHPTTDPMFCARLTLLTSIGNPFIRLSFSVIIKP
jgi:hypothetical protein